MSLDAQRNWANRPLGMRDVFPQQAKRRRQLENHLLSYFEQYGYEMVSSGAFEYVDTLLRGRPVQQAEDWVQLFDGTGKAVALRPDMTPSIARMAALLVANGHSEIRWSYAERVYRRITDLTSLSWVSGKAAESTQVGVEWIGKTGAQTDCDLIGVCQTALVSLDLPDWQMVVSHAAFAPAFLRAYGTPQEAVDVLLRLLSQGDYVGFRQECVRLEVPTRLLDIMGSLNPYQPDSFGAELRRGWTDAESARVVERAWNDMVDLARHLSAQGLDGSLSFDLTLYRDLAYYTGIVFEVFTTGVGAPIALGGRYDSLLTQFGAQAPAIGFTFEIERLLSVLTDGSWLHAPSEPNRVDSSVRENLGGEEGKC